MTTAASRAVKGKSAIIFIVGPTAIGKTALAIKVARRVKGEIISADSMQIYKGMRILSQAPSVIEKRKARHHLVGSLDSGKEYSVALFIKKAPGIINSIIKKRRIPIIAGGSGLYVRGLIDGLFTSPEADEKFRKRMAGFAARYGSKKLHSKLAKIDPQSAKKIHPNDLRRTIRALELHELTGKTMTELKSSTRGLKDKYNIKIFGLIMPRDEIYSRIDERVDKMFRGRVMEEVRNLRRKRLSKTAKGVLGFSEISAHLAGRCTRDEAKDMLKMNTRRFAKRQLTWFRPDKRIKWLDIGKMSLESAALKIAKAMGN
jgi:tRNA dimethylallyltransferase